MIESAKKVRWERQLINSKDFNREYDLEQSIRIIASEDAELLERLDD
jgi:hypothetical protein